MLTGLKGNFLSEVKAMTEAKIVNNLTKEEEIIKEKEEYLAAKPMTEHPAYVSVMAGATISLPSYSSGKISVSITYPCNPNNVDDVYEKLKDWVDKRVEKEVLELRAVSEKSNKVEI